jgi:hypothetical protein
VAGAALAAAVGATGRATAVEGVEGAAFLGVKRSPEYAAAAAPPAKIKARNHCRPAPALFPTTDSVRVAGACDIVVGILEPRYLRECSVRSSPAMSFDPATDCTPMMIEVSVGIHVFRSCDHNVT